MVAHATSDNVCDWGLIEDTKQYSTGIYQIFGYAYDEIENTSKWWLDKIHPDDLEKVNDMISNTLNKGGLYFRTELRFRCAEEDYKLILYRSYILRNDSKKPIRIISSMQDISERNIYIKAIEDQNKRLKEISWTQSHIVRGPLTRIMGLVNLISTLAPENIFASELLEYLMTSANELDDVIKAIVKNAEVES